MGKHSAKKFKKEELNKVKFKIGRKLPKNLNETRAQFKAKTLILKQQFQLEKEGPVSHRNLTIKELLVHLNHHNQSIRFDSLNSLKDMLQKNSDFILSYELSNVLESICPLFIDREYKIRKQINEFIKLLINILITNNKLNLLKPFYKLLNAHLSCAMTHIDENIQYNSLILLDIFIQYLPNLICLHSYNIFENFIEQISKITTNNNQSNGTSVNFKNNLHRRTLKNDPYKLTSTQSWRSNVLSRLYKILLIVSNSNNGENNEISCNKIENGCLIKFNDVNEGVLYRFDNCLNVDSLKISKRLLNTKTLNDIKAFFIEYMPIIVPLLLDCWIEAKPEESNVIENNESFEIMHSVLNILNLILDNLNIGFSEILENIKVSKKSTSYMENLFLTDFPYILSECYRNSSNDKKLNIQSQASINAINLLICKFSISSILELDSEKLVTILEYCLNLLDTSNKQHPQISNSDLGIILKFSEVILNNFTTPELIKPFLARLFEFFDKTPTFSSLKWLVFEFLADQFYKNAKLLQLSNNGIAIFFNKALKYCILFEKEKKVDKLEKIFDILRKFLIRKHSNILKSFHDEFINLLNALDFEDEKINDNCKKKLLELIYFMSKINNYLFTKLSIIIINKKISFSCVNQILGILRLKYEDENESFTKSDYLMFLLTLFNGYTGFDLTSTIPDNYKINDEYILVDENKIEHHLNLCKYLKEFLMTHSNYEQIIDIILSSSIQVLNELDIVPCSTVYGTLILISEINISNVNYGKIIIFMMKKILDWCYKKFYQTSDDYMMKIINLLCLIIKKNSNFINDYAPNLKKHKLIETYNRNHNEIIYN